MAQNAKTERRRAAQQVGSLVGAIVDPVIAKRAGMTSALLAAWPDIAGARYAGTTRPERVIWPRRPEDGSAGEQATLVVACEAATAMRLSHETGEVAERINVFLGYPAIGRIRIVQKPVAEPMRGPGRKIALDGAEEDRIRKLTAAVEDDALRSALVELGRSVRAERKSRR